MSDDLIAIPFSGSLEQFVAIGGGGHVFASALYVVPGVCLDGGARTQSDGKSRWSSPGDNDIFPRIDSVSHHGSS